MAKNRYSSRGVPFSRKLKALFVLLICVAACLLALFLWLRSQNVVSDTEDPFLAGDSGAAADIVTPEDAAEEEGEDVPDVPEEDPSVIKGIVNKGESASTLFRDFMSYGEILEMSEACREVFALEQLRAGQPYVIYRENDGFSRFEYEINNDKRLIVCRLPGEFTAELEEIHYDVELSRVAGNIQASLFLSMADLGESPILPVRLSEIFAWEINFIKDIKKNDSFEVVVEKRFRDGEFKGYGKILAARFVNQGKTFEAFLHVDAAGNIDYYDAAGESIKRAFLKAPLAYNRISSGYTNRRLHPIQNTWKAHPAIDYAAPTGTPVKAIGNGVVTFRGWGKGAGNYIVLKHTAGYESMYLHLSAFAKNLKKGQTVRQGEVIGFVGSTGFATGPHLDFRMKKDGNYVNPLKVLAPKSEPLTKESLPRFLKNKDLYKAYLDGEKDLAEYLTEKEAALP